LAELDAVRALGDRLGKVKVGRSSISFSRLADIDLAALLDLVGRARVLTSAPS
jgi:hypothetical protein